MDLSLTENQEMLRNSAREFIEREYPKDVLLALEQSDTGYTPELWDKVARLGWSGIVIPQEYGGEGGSFTDAGVLFQELGRGPIPGPLFSGVLGALAVLEGGTEAQRRQILPSVAQGAQRLALAVGEPDYGWGPDRIGMSATRRNGRFILNGTKLFVHDALAATHFICAVATGDGGDSDQGISLLVVEANSPGLSARSLPGFIAGVGEVTFDSVEVPASGLLGEETGAGWTTLERAMEKAIPVLCAYEVGGCEAVYEMSVAYSQTRVQFGVPIGRFQRVQDQIINLLNHLDSARWTTYEALSKLDSGRPAASAVHLAKAVSSEAYYQACNYAHEVHAGVGVMKEYGLTLHTKMSRTLYHCLGGPRYHKRRLAEVLDV